MDYVMVCQSEFGVGRLWHVERLDSETDIIDLPVRKKHKLPFVVQPADGATNASESSQERESHVINLPQEKRGAEFRRKWLNDKYVETLGCTKEHTIAYMDDPGKMRTLEKCEGTIKANLHGFVAVCIVLYEIRK